MCVYVHTVQYHCMHSMCETLLYTTQSHIYMLHITYIFTTYIQLFSVSVSSHLFLTSPLMVTLSFYYSFCVVPVHMLFGTWPCWLYVEYLQVCTSFTSPFLPPPLALSLCVCVPCLDVCVCVCVCVSACACLCRWTPVFTCTPSMGSCY